MEQNQKSKRGKLIVFEGLDKAGKSTQCERVVENLEGRGLKVRHVRFPGQSGMIYIYIWKTCIDGKQTETLQLDR